MGICTPNFCLHGDEVVFHGSHQQEKSLKGLITDADKVFEAKYHQAMSGRNCITLYLTSNDERPVPLGDGARRYFVTKSSACIKDDPARGEKYLSELFHSWVDPEVAGAIFHKLQQIDLSDFDPERSAPETSTMTRTRAKFHTPVEAFIQSRLECGKILRGRDFVKTGTPTAAHIYTETQSFGGEAKTGDPVAWRKGGISFRKVGSRQFDRQQRLYDEFLQFRTVHAFEGVVPRNPRELVDEIIGVLLPRDVSPDEEALAYKNKSIPGIDQARRIFAEKILINKNHDWESTIENDEVTTESESSESPDLPEEVKKMADLNEGSQPE